MNVLLKSAGGQSGVEGFLARYEGLAERLPGDRALREQAAEAFRSFGLPTIRDEAWKYTNLRPIAEALFHEPLVPLGDCAALMARLPTVDAPRLVFVDAHFREDLSVLPTKAIVDSFAERPNFGRFVRFEEPLVALNAMLAEDGAYIEVPAGVDVGVVQLVSLATDPSGRAVAFHPRHTIKLGAGARLTVLEVSVGDGTYLHNPVTEVVLGEDATLAHIRLQDESSRAYHLATLYAEIAARATYDSFTLVLGGRLGRLESHARLAGPGASAHLNAAQILGGVQHADFTTVVAHDAPACASRQTVKNVLAGRSRGVFQGRIEVARGAQKTDGYQMNQALLLSPEAEVDSKPELKIYADDVKCSHGATVGELDAEQIFYLRSRGIPEAEARAILVRAFLAEALDVVANEPIRAALDRAVESWWTREAA
jgi:Fe-S cluster assembly protein SufD